MQLSREPRGLSRHPRYEGRRRHAAGFTLIELIVVVAVLAVIAVMTIPALLNSKKQTNESATVANLRTISQAQLQYRTRFGTYGELDDLSNAQLTASTFVDGTRQGYTFTSANTADVSRWTIIAEPENPGVSGDRHFYIDQSGVIRYREGAPATASDSPVE